MSLSILQNTTATSSKKRQRDKRNERNTTSGPSLKSTRNEAKSSNSSRLKEKESDEPAKKDAFQKQEERLAPIQSLLASLPEPFDVESKAFASNLLSQAIQVIHCNRRLEYHEKNPSFIPSSIRFKHKLTCKVEHEENDIFITQRALSKKILDNAIQELRQCMVKVMKMEQEGAIFKLQELYVTGLHALFNCYSNYYKFAYPDNATPYTNEEGAEILLQKFFEEADDSIYEYLHCTKVLFTNKHITSRHNRVEYGASDTFTPEQNQLCDTFCDVAKKEIFHSILPITVGLKKSYIDELNKKEAISRTKALIKNRNTTSITASTAEALEKEDNVQPENLRALIDD